jgi:hypothetical protein
VRLSAREVLLCNMKYSRWLYEVAAVRQLWNPFGMIEISPVCFWHTGLLLCKKEVSLRGGRSPTWQSPGLSNIFI